MQASALATMLTSVLASVQASALATMLASVLASALATMLASVPLYPSTGSSSSLGSENMDSEGEETMRVNRWGNSTTNSTNEENSGSDEEMFHIYSGDCNVLEEVYAKYMVVECICIGGFGGTYSGFRRKDNFLVVLKYISKRNVTFTEMEVNGAMCRLPLEVSLLIQVGAGPDSSGSNITPLLLDWYDLGSEIVLVIERPEPCVDLVDYLRSQETNVLEPAKAQYFFGQLVEATIEMEAKGVFHRDIKPKNVLIETGEENRARFIDFGCGTTFTPGQTFDEPQGTALYGSPEWFRKKRYAARPVTVWQLGLTLYAMLFSRKSLISECTSGSRRRVSFPCPVSDECRDLLKGCLAINPKKRLTLEKIRDHPWLNAA
ncbi:serine/threonine-protein kinase pim-1-like [Eucyclogobius newberryi]|uniref:serine/threonine-protein kinase pim-1-like n=1 Tax=Eucyclogobius newberryi TaxID=166745 RepID=UPI003B5B91F5